MDIFKLLNTSEGRLSVPLAQFNISEKEFYEDICRLQEWYRQQPHLPEKGLDERLLKRILIYNKFNTEKTKKKIDNLLSAKSLFPELFSKRDPWCDEIKYMMEIVDYGVVPYLTPENERIVIFKVNPNDPMLYDPLVHVSYACMLIEVRSMADTNTKDIMICDFQNVKLMHFLKCNPSFLKKIVYTFEQCYTARYSSIYIINCPNILVKSVNMISSFMKKKMQEKIVFIDKIETLHHKIPKKYLPKDLGGDLPKTCRELSNDLREVAKSPFWRQWLLDSEDMRSDESKRLGKADYMLNEILGTVGTFRKLDID